MSYYKGNAVYDELGILDDPNLLWVSGNAWLLIYADSNELPRLLLLAGGRSAYAATGPDLARLKRVAGIASSAATLANIPFWKLGFDDTQPSIASVRLNDGTPASQRLTLDELKGRFAEVGLRVAGSPTTKGINSEGSSAYHDWQRRALPGIKVTDIDLLRLNPVSGEIVEIIELKRSFYSLADWEPYADDFTNFNVIAQLCAKIGARFTIGYNQRTKAPLNDNATQLAIFAYTTPPASATRVKEVAFHEFAAGNY